MFKCVYLGTGGANMFALLFLLDINTGIIPIMASSSDAKIAQIEKFSGHGCQLHNPSVY